jgi:hypothetical protein
MATIPTTIPGEWQCTAEEYHGDVEFVSRSALDVFSVSPRRYRGIYVTGMIEPEPPTKQMITGSLSHLFVLEPDRLATDAVVIPAEVLAKNGAKSTNAYHDFAAANPGKLLVKEEEMATAKGIVDSIYSDDIARKLLRGGKCEHTIVWQDQETGLMCKSRLDYLRPDLIIDFKTTEDVRPAAFHRTASNQRYFRQQEFYGNGAGAVYGKRPRFVFMVVSKSPPYDVAFHELDEEFEAIGREQIRKDLNALADCLETDDWRAPWQKQVNKLRPHRWLANSEWEI